MSLRGDQRRGRQPQEPPAEHGLRIPGKDVHGRPEAVEEHLGFS